MFRGHAGAIGRDGGNDWRQSTELRRSARGISATSIPNDALPTCWADGDVLLMVIFVPMFIGLFIVAPALATWLAADLLRIRGFAMRFVLFMVIAVGNWQWWQAPHH